MRIAIIGCMVMNREISHLVSESKNKVRVWWLRQGLHDTPEILHAELQRTIDDIEKENSILRAEFRFEAIVLAYGLCSNGVIGLRSRSIPIVVPRCDDCISLFLGSADRYRKYFREYPGTYWYNRGWIEQAFTPSKHNYAIRRTEYVEKYGEENADYLMACTNDWMTKYTRCGFITSPGNEDAAYEEYAKQAAEDFGWEFRKFEGSMSYLTSLVEGPWEDNQFLTCPPHSRIVADYTNRKFRSVPCGIDDNNPE
jgi:hypothetical protein